MLVPVVDLLGEILAVVDLEETAVIEGELLGSGLVAVADDRDETTGEGLNAGDGLNLDIGGVDVQVAHVDGLDEVLLVVEAKDGVDVELVAQGSELVLSGAGASEDEDDVIAVLRLGDSLDEDGLALLHGEAADHEDEELALQLLGALHRLGLEGGLDAVGDHVEVVAVVVASELVGDELAGAVDALDLLVEGLTEALVDDAVGPAETLQTTVVGDVLGLDMEGGGAGDAELLGHLAGRGGELEGHVAVHDVAAGDGSSEDLLVGLSEGHALPGGDVGDEAVLVLGDDVHVLASLAGGDDADLVAALTELLNKSSG